jgi:hypothetical protein
LLEEQEGTNDNRNLRVTHIGDIVPNISPLGSYVQFQPNYFINSGNDAIATVANISLNTDPENVTPEITLQALLFNFSSIRNNTSAAHAQYINNIEACGDLIPMAPLSPLSGTQPAATVPPLDPDSLRPAAIGSVLDIYFSKVRNGTVTPHRSRTPGSKGRRPGVQSHRAHAPDRPRPGNRKGQ